MGRRSESISFPVQHCPLYCFKIIENDESMELRKYKITEYNNFQYNRSVSDYKFEGKFIESTSKVDSIRNDKMNKVINKKYFTFNPDQKIVEKAFDAYFKESFIDASIKANNAEQRYNLWRKRNDQ